MCLKYKKRHGECNKKKKKNHLMYASLILLSMKQYLIVYD